MSPQKIILGIDPGLATIGYAFIRGEHENVSVLDFGVFTTPSTTDFSERLLMIHRDLGELIEQYQPDEAYVEELFFSSNAKTALDVAHARGVIIASLAERGLRPQSITPNQVKLAATGDGGADKRQVQEMLQLQFQLSELPRPDDAADALAIAFCGALRSHRSLDH